jgi:glucose/arabinose dehydrogenase
MTRGKIWTRTSRLALTAAILASVPFAALAQPAVRYGTPGVTQPLTAAEIARETPTNVLTGALVGNTPEVHKSEGGMAIKVTKLAEGLSHPNGLVFLPDGHTMLLTERAGRLRVVKDGVLDPTPVAGVPDMDHFALGGLQDIVLHPDFAKNHILYISYSKNRLPALGTTLAVSRARYENGKLLDVKEILVTEAWESPLGTYGGRMIFGPDGMLYISVGDRDGTTSNDISSARPQAQKLDSDIGKILRVKDDGSIPADNPFVKTPGARGEIFSYGHRNVYGMAWDPKTGQMWTSEFGPFGGDEINMEYAGHNYGWPLVSMGRNYSGHLVSDQPWYREGMDNAKFAWTPTFNPENMFFYTGDKFPRLKGSLIVAGAGSKKIAQVSINGDFVSQGDTMLHDLNVRFRDIRQGPDGFIYTLTEGRLRGPKDTDGMLLRLEPGPAAASQGNRAGAPSASPD